MTEHQKKIIQLWKQRKFKEASELGREHLIKEGYAYYEGMGWVHNEDVNFLVENGVADVRDDRLVLTCPKYITRDDRKIADPEWVKKAKACFEEMEKVMKNRKKKNHAVNMSVQNLLATSGLSEEFNI